MFCILCTVFLCHGCSSEMARVAGILEPPDGRSSKFSTEERVVPESAEMTGEPRIMLENTSYNVGEVKPMTKTNAVFNFRNVGDSTLQIMELKSCCGVPAKVDKKDLMPGEAGVLTAQYSAGPVTGVFAKKVSMLTNDPQEPRIELTITGKVVQTLTWEPTHFEVSTANDMLACPAITIRSLNGAAFSVRGFSATGECMTAAFDPAHRATEFTLKPRAEMAKLELLTGSRGRLSIDLDHPDYKVVYVDFDVVPLFEVIPRQVVVFDAKPGEPILRSVQLRYNQAVASARAPFDVASVVSKTGARVEVRSVTQIDMGCEIQLTIWPRGDDAHGSFSADQLLIKMKDGPELNVPVRVFYQSPQLSNAAHPGPNP
jgi:hypothetical protein